jgi:hypothetical protein
MDTLKIGFAAIIAFCAWLFGWFKRGLYGFFYKNDCVLCVWARYCLFFMLGIIFSTWGNEPSKIITAVFILAASFCAVFIGLSMIPAEKKGGDK